MENFLLALAARFWPDLRTYNDQRRLVGISDVISFFYTLPLAVVGVVWLMRVTDLALVRREWKTFLLFALITYLFARIDYFIIVEIRTDRYGSAKGSLNGMLQWSAVFLFGPTTLWLSILAAAGENFWNLVRSQSTAARWNILRNLAHDLAGYSLVYLAALSLYASLGGRIPLTGLSMPAIFQAMACLLAYFLLNLLVWSVYIAFGMWTQNLLAGPETIKNLLHFVVLALALPNLSYPFAILASGLYVQNGVFAFLFFIAGLFLVGLLARRLSWAAESNRQRSRQLEMLEKLSRAIINAPPDASLLAQLLEEHVPAMLPSARTAIYLDQDELLIKKPTDWELNFKPVWEWSRTIDQPRAYLAKDHLPWRDAPAIHDPLLITPIRDIDGSLTLGCIYVELRSLAQPWDKKALQGLLPGLRTLSDQIASSIRQAQVYSETLDYQRTQQELKFAGRIQSSLLPIELPDLAGYELAVSLQPARETSGDFFDFIPLSEHKIGLLIADVADKGIAAALYMALCRTLIRTYAIEYLDATPDVVFFATNERLLKDARVNLFVTAFYGILDQETGLLTYCNAGHNPPYLIAPQNGHIHTLSSTGMPLGIEADSVWTLASAKIAPGDALVIYTDGIPDAHNQDGDFFREKRLVESARTHIHLPAQDMLVGILNDVRQFVGPEPQFDDITLMVLTRDK